MTQCELLEILEKHRKWLVGEDGGECASMSNANLRDADLSSAYLGSAYLSNADLRGANLSGANLSGANLRRADLSGADLRGADLRGADLSGANLRDADLSNADLYNCCLPLWCGGLRITLDRRQMAQLIYHFCSMECEDSEVLALQKSLYAFANEFAESRDDLKNKKFPEVAAQREDK